MLTLAIDTTTRAGSVAVLRAGAPVAVVIGDGARTHGERLPGELAQALAIAGLTPRDLELLVVATGPGAFTGLRIGLAAVQGLAMVSGTPVVGVSALDALALAARRAMPGPAVAAWMDAQRDEVFAAVYAPAAAARLDLAPHAVPAVGSAAAMIADIPDEWRAEVVFAGDGVERHRDAMAAALGRPPRIAARPEALAPLLGELGIAAAQRGEAGPPHTLQPLYVRRPDAELVRQRRGTP